MFKAKKIITDSAYLIHEKGLYKVQVGDYQFYPQADKVKITLQKNEFPGAWIVKRPILVPLTSSAKDDNLDPRQSLSVNKSGKYRIQVMVTSSQDKAIQIVNELKQQLNYPVFFEQTGTLFKVFIGAFQVEKKAREVLQMIRSGGYADAWLVY